MKIFLLLVAAFLFATNIACLRASPIDSCLKMIWANEGDEYNPDSVRVDTCSGSTTFKHRFSKTGYFINFPRNFYPFDHILDSGEEKGVGDIDSAHLGLKNRFHALQDTFGLIFFKGLDYSATDSIEYLNPSIHVFFEKYQDFEFITEYLTNTVDSINVCGYSYKAKILLSTMPETTEFQRIQIYPNPVKNILLVKNQSTAKTTDRMEIFSLEGKKIFDCTYTETLDVSFLQSGVYILKINNSSIKFLKE